MTLQEQQAYLARSRLRQAEESLAEARFLLAGGMSTRSVVNRVYYSMFYSVLALLVFEPYASSKHKGVIGYFNQRFVAQGEMSRHLGRALNKAFDLRQRGDYREEVEIPREQAEGFLPMAESLISAVRENLAGRGLL